MRAFHRRQPVQQTDDSAVDVLERQALEAAGEFAQTMAEVADQHHREVGMVSNELAQIDAGHGRAGGWLQRDHRGTAHIAIERDLAHIFAGAVLIQDDFLAGLIGRVHLDPARQNDEQRVRRVALVNDHRVRWVTSDGGRGGNLAQHAFLQEMRRCRRHGRGHVRQCIKPMPCPARGAADQPGRTRAAKVCTNFSTFGATTNAQ